MIAGWWFGLGALVGATAICALTELPQSAMFFTVSAAGWGAGRLLWR